MPIPEKTYLIAEFASVTLTYGDRATEGWGNVQEASGNTRMRCGNSSVRELRTFKLAISADANVIGSSSRCN